MEILLSNMACSSHPSFLVGGARPPFLPLLSNTTINGPPPTLEGCVWAGLIGLVVWPLMVALQLGPMPINVAIKLKLYWATGHQLGGLLPQPVLGGKHTHGWLP